MFFKAGHLQIAQRCIILANTVLHCHIAVGAAVPKRAPLFLEGDEVPYGHHGVVRHIEVEQFHAGEGVESIQLTRRAGEVFSHKKAICGDKSGCPH